MLIATEVLAQSKRKINDEGRGWIVASVPGLPRSRMRIIYLSACGTRIVGQERGRPGIKYHVRVGPG